MTVQTNGNAAAVAKFARSLVGIHETPAHSNDGPGVHTIQSVTGAYRAPWCVSTVQFIVRHVLGFTIADRTANAYYLAAYAEKHGWTIPKPVVGAAVVYHLGAGHAGTVVQVNRGGAFLAVEGNEGDAVRLVERDPRGVKCTFILHPELRKAKPAPKPKPTPPAKPAALAVQGPKGGTIIRAGSVSRVAGVLPALVRKLGRVTITKGR